MDERSWYKIKDLVGFINHARELVFKSFGEINETADDDLTYTLSELAPKDKEELNRILTYDECVVIARNHIKIKISKKTKRESYFVNDMILSEILESFNSRMVSNILAKLVNDGLIDTAFDSEKNDFIFWVVDKDNNK
ncbi:hypothetical protein EB001_25965 [bacterium]|nr:hypothetical protein [bacterium]